MKKILLVPILFSALFFNAFAAKINSWKIIQDEFFVNHLVTNYTLSSTGFSAKDIKKEIMYNSIKVSINVDFKKVHLPALTTITDTIPLGDLYGTFEVKLTLVEDYGTSQQKDSVGGMNDEIKKDDFNIYMAPSESSEVTSEKGCFSPLEYLIISSKQSIDHNYRGKKIEKNKNGYSVTRYVLFDPNTYLKVYYHPWPSRNRDTVLLTPLVKGANTIKFSNIQNGKVNYTQTISTSLDLIKVKCNPPKDIYLANSYFEKSNYECNSLGTIHFQAFGNSSTFSGYKIKKINEYTYNLEIQNQLKIKEFPKKSMILDSIKLDWSMEERAKSRKNYVKIYYVKHTNILDSISVDISDQMFCYEIQPNSPNECDSVTILIKQIVIGKCEKPLNYSFEVDYNKDSLNIAYSKYRLLYICIGDNNNWYVHLDTFSVGKLKHGEYGIYLKRNKEYIAYPGPWPIPYTPESKYRIIKNFEVTKCIPLANPHLENTVQTISPNPFHNCFNFSSANNQSYRIENLDGVVVEKGKLNSQPIGCDLSSGTYILRISNSDGSQTIEKVIKR